MKTTMFEIKIKYVELDYSTLDISGENHSVPEI